MANIEVVPTAYLDCMRQELQRPMTPRRIGGRAF